MRLSPLLAALAVTVLLSASVSVAGVPGPAGTLVDARDPGGVPSSSAVDGVGAPASDATTPSAANVTNRSRVLAVPGPAVQTTRIRTATLDLGPSTEFGGNLTAIRMETTAIESTIEGTDDSDQRRLLVRASLREVERETDSLRERRQAAIESYNRGELTTQEFLVELATIGARADAYEARVSTLQRLAEETEGWSDQGASHVRSRSESVRYQLRALGGPVSDRAMAAIRGTAPATRVFVTTGPEGYELATITNGTYVREAYRGAVRQNNASASMTPSAAADVVGESYPNVMREGGDAGVIGSGSTYVVTVPRDGGSLTAFVDSDSERVFREYQRISLDTIGPDSTETNVESGLRLTVNRSYPGGPARVYVTDIETGEPVNATITVSQNGAQGVVVGRTGDDGILWTLSPRGEYTVVANAGGTSIGFVETNSTETPAID